MSTFRLDKYEDTNKASDTPASPEPVDVGATQPENNGVNVDASKAEITISGPLSSVYANALRQVLAEKAVEVEEVENVSTESVMAQLSTILNIPTKQVKPESTVIYVEDAGKVDADSYDKLRLALDQRGKKIVVFENFKHHITPRVGLLERMAVESGATVMYSVADSVSRVSALYVKGVK